MRSFSTYRKQCLRESMQYLSPRGCSQALVEILKLDLLEHIELPEIITENVVAKAEFNRFRKAYSLHNKHVVENLCNYTKNHFYDVLLAESGDVVSNARTPADALRMLRDELRTNLMQMVNQLKIAVQGAATVSNGPESPEDAARDAEPNDAGQPAPVGGMMGHAPSPASPASGGHAPSPSGSPSNFNAGSSSMPNHAGSNPGTGPTVKGAWNDLMTSLRPKDGWWNGIKRVVGRPFRDAGRYIKKNWYDENHQVLESMLNEQNAHILDLIDKFGKDMLDLINNKSAEIAKSFGIDLDNSAPVVGPSGSPTNDMEDPASRPMDAVDAPVAANTEQDREASGTDPNSVIGKKAEELKAAAASGDKVAESKIQAHNRNLTTALQVIAKTDPHIAHVVEEITAPQIGRSKMFKLKPQHISQTGKAARSAIKPIVSIIANNLGIDRDPAYHHYSHIMGLKSTHEDHYFPTIRWLYENKFHKPMPQAEGMKMLVDMLLNFGSVLRQGSQPSTETSPEAAPASPNATPTMPEAPVAGEPQANPAEEKPEAVPAKPTMGKPTMGEPTANVPDESGSDVGKEIYSAIVDAASRNRPAAKQVLDSLGDEGLKTAIKDGLSTMDKNMPKEDLMKSMRDYLVQHASSRPMNNPEVAPAEPVTAEPERAAPEVAPTMPEAKPANLSSIKDILRKKKEAQAQAQAQAQNASPEEQLKGYADHINKIVGSHDEEQLPKVMAKEWFKIAADVMGADKAGDEVENLLKSWNDAVATDPAAAVKMMQDELIDIKKKQLAPKAESFKDKVDRYVRMIKETKSNNPNKGLRDKLGLS